MSCGAVKECEVTEVGNSIVLDSNLGTSEVEPLYDTLKCLLATEQDVTINGANVESIDTSVVQLLVAFTKSIEDSGCRVTWDEVSEKLEKTNGLLGLNSWVHCD